MHGAEALALRRLRRVAAATLLAVDANDALLDVEVAEAHVERFGDPAPVPIRNDASGR